MLGGQRNYVAKAMPGQVRSWVLDPQLFPNSSISFETRPTDNTPPVVLGPYRVNKGETIDLVVPNNFARMRATIHRSVP